MKHDEFAFLNQQLAAMLREGIPLEGALRQLSANMRRGTLRAELEALEADLARGTPLADALQPRNLPELYKRMVSVGARSQDLPGVLNLLADFYHAQHLQWTKLKGLMTYPLIVLTVMFIFSLAMHIFAQRFFLSVWGEGILGAMNSIVGTSSRMPVATRLSLQLLVHSWVFPVGMGLLLAAVLGVLFLPSLRSWFRWQLPAFREAGLAQVAGMMALMLERSVPLPEALALIEQLEHNTAARRDLGVWRERLAQGVANFTDVAAGSRLFPPLFIWLATHAGVSLAEGFRRAAEIYRTRAAARSDIMLHAALPVAVLTLGMIAVTQTFVMMSIYLPFIVIMDQIGSPE